jgi:hypothetical protein
MEECGCFLIWSFDMKRPNAMISTIAIIANTIFPAESGNSLGGIWVIIASTPSGSKLVSLLSGGVVLHSIGLECGAQIEVAQVAVVRQKFHT